MGVMCADYFLIQKQKIKISNLYHPQGSDYWYTAGINWRVILAWIAGWALTIGGLIVSVQKKTNALRALYQLYYLAFFIGGFLLHKDGAVAGVYGEMLTFILGFAISAVLFYVLTIAFPVQGAGEVDDVDIYGTFTPEEAMRLGVAPLDTLVGIEEEKIISPMVEEVGVGKTDTVKKWFKG